MILWYIPSLLANSNQDFGAIRLEAWKTRAEAAEKEVEELRSECKGAEEMVETWQWWVKLPK